MSATTPTTPTTTPSPKPTAAESRYAELLASPFPLGRL